MVIADGDRADQKTDFYHSFRFVVVDDQGYIGSDVTTIAGFSNCTLPEHNIEHIEYSEGIWTYSKMYPGRSTFSTVTLSKGVVAGFSSFATWILACAEGKNYRTNITIQHLHREDVRNLAGGNAKADNYGVSRQIVCKNCLPIRFRPGHDFDSMSSDISITEIEFQPETFTVIQSTPGTGLK